MLTRLTPPMSMAWPTWPSWRRSPTSIHLTGQPSQRSSELVTTTNHWLSGLAAIDGFTPSADDCILIAGQSSAAATAYLCAASGAWARATDLDATAELIAGITVYVKQGSTKANTQWVLTFSGTANLGTTAQTWTQSGAGTIPSDADAATPSLRSLGTGATQALPGNHESTTNTRTPTDGTVTAAKFATNADIPRSRSPA